MIDMNKKINVVWLVLGLTCLGYTLRCAIFHGHWAPFFGFVIAVGLCFLFLRKHDE
jgi:hypothetical protein